MSHNAAPASSAEIMLLAAPERSILSVAGADAESFLQGLLTNDVAAASAERAVYAALLTPQGKFLADALLWRPEPERFVLDMAAAFAPDLKKRFALYKLRSAVTIEDAADLGALALWAEAAPSEALARAAQETAREISAVASGPDPRVAALGWRLIAPRDSISRLAPAATTDEFQAYERKRIAEGVPAAGLDLRPNDGFVLEYGFERLQGVDFQKGCFVGQEIVARMKHKSTLKKGLYRLRYEGPDPAPGDEILSDGKPAGSVGSALGGAALGLLRIDRAAGALSAGAATITAAEPIE
ncbi:MAG: folate-binding protein [Pseudomonadota bacterium]